MIRLFCHLLILPLAFFSLAACTGDDGVDDGPVEDSAENVGDAVEKTGEAIKDGVDATGDAIEKGADATGDAIEDAAEKTGDAMD